MTIEKPNYTEHAQAPESRAIKELDMMKVQIVEMVEGAKVGFPIKDRAALLRIFPKSTPVACSYKGNQMTMYDLIEHLDESDFPIQGPGDLATILTTRCFL
ncbi:MAG TPA: MTH865 family protein [Methanocella sp.]|nr:MTH865 family protein [Methanocella sp.]